MKVKVLQEDLLRGLNNVSRFVTTRAQLPILSNVLISTEKNGIKLASTNLETGIVAQVPAKIEEIGSITVPARTVNEIIANISSGTIDVSSSGEELVISNKNTKVRLAGISSADFPQVPDKIEKEDYVLPSDILNLIKNQVVFSAATDETRPILTGVLFSFSKGKLQAVATDGFRLSCKEIELKNNIQESKILISAKIIDELCHIIGESKEQVRVSVLEKTKQILFASQNFVLTGRVLEGEFPDFQRIIPKSFVYRATTDKESLLKGVRAVGILARESSNIAKFNIEGGSVSLSSESKQHGDEEVTVDAKTEGGETEIAFNYKFIQDFLNSVQGREVSLETENSTSAVVFRDTKDLSYFHLIMPIRLQN